MRPLKVVKILVSLIWFRPLVKVYYSNIRVIFYYDYPYPRVSLYNRLLSVIEGQINMLKQIQ